MPNWRELVIKAAHNEPDYRLIFNPPASTDRLLAAQKHLRITFPEDLQNFLLTFNGVGETIASEPTDSIIFPIVYSLDRLIDENVSFRQNLDVQHSHNFGRAERLLLFSDILTADYIAYGMTDDGIPDGRIVFYDHEVVETRQIATTLEEFFAVWASRKI
jgi:hypothetical protein